MRIILSAILLMLSYINAGASTYSADYDHKKDVCRSFMNLASHAMSARQYGIPMSKPLESMYEVASSPAEKFVNQKIHDIIINAYRSDIYETEKTKSDAISDFSAKYYIECADDFGL